MGEVPGLEGSGSEEREKFRFSITARTEYYQRACRSLAFNAGLRSHPRFQALLERYKDDVEGPARAK